MRRNFLLIASIVCFGGLSGQTLVSFEQPGKARIIQKTGGVIDTMASNPNTCEINKSEKCAKYVRWRGVKYDFVKFTTNSPLTNAEKLVAGEHKIRLKVYSAAAPGTLIQIQLGKKEIAQAYPKGTYAQFEGVTTKQNEWEEIEFKYHHSPSGSVVKAGQVNTVTLLFSPGTYSGETFFFDDLSGIETEDNEGLKER